MRLNYKFLGMPVLAATLLSATASAASVGTGNFSLSGGAMGSTGGINFYFASTPPTFDQKAVVIPAAGGAPGVFADLTVGTIQTIQNLTTANGVIPGTTFDFANWIQLTDGVNLDAMTIPLPSLSVCPTVEPAGGFTGNCVLNAQSPVIVSEGSAGVNLKFSVFGGAHFAGQTTETPFDAEFGASDTLFKTVAAFETFFNANGSIPALPYEVNVSTTAPTTVPEPAAFWMTCAGMVGFGILKRRRGSRKA